MCILRRISVTSDYAKSRENTAREKSVMLKTAVALRLQGLLNKCNLVYLAEWSMKDFSPILHNSLWGGPWNNFESTSNNCFAQRVILVSGVTQLQSTTMCSCSCNFDNKQLFVCHAKVKIWAASDVFVLLCLFFCLFEWLWPHQILNSCNDIPKPRSPYTQCNTKPYLLLFWLLFLL